MHKIIKDADGDGSSSGLMGNIFSSNGSKLPNTLTSWTRYDRNKGSNGGNMFELVL